jgi:hypothetical protein
VLFYQACLPLSQHIRNKPEIHGFEKEWGITFASLDMPSFFYPSPLYSNPIKRILCNYWVDLCGSALEKGASMLQKDRFWLFLRHSLSLSAGGSERDKNRHENSRKIIEKDSIIRALPHGIWKSATGDVTPNPRTTCFRIFTILVFSNLVSSKPLSWHDLNALFTTTSPASTMRFSEILNGDLWKGNQDVSDGTNAVSRLTPSSRLQFVTRHQTTAFVQFFLTSK